MDDFRKYTFTPEAGQILCAAEEAARALGADCMRTEHLVLGFLSDSAARIARLLERGGVNKEELQATIQRIRIHEASCESRLPGYKFPMSAEFRNVIRSAHQERSSHSDPRITEFTLLAALLEQGCSTGMYCLRRHYGALDTLRHSFQDFLGEPTPPSPPPAPPAPPRPVRTPDGFHWSERPGAMNRLSGSLPVPWRYSRPYSRRARQALDNAVAAAREHGVEWIGSAYLLFGLSAARGSVSAAVLDSLGLAANNVKAVIAELTPVENTTIDRLAQPQPTRELKLAVNKAAELAHVQQSDVITPEHLLFALLSDGQNNASYLLYRMNVDAEDIFDDLHRALDTWSLAENAE
jgi:ATP-dependent Clp protease ATP-binding subunit ClpA